ncbi:MAG: CARDB domain-containing protein [Candidatus Micrarchaeales archaeon]
MEKINAGKILMTAIAVMMLGLQIASAQAVNGAISLSQLSVTPQPVVAGGNVTISFQLFNSYTSTLNNVVLQLTASNPIINVSPSTSVLINSVAAGGTVSSGGISSFSYKLHIPSTLTAGEYTIDIQATYESASGSGGQATQEPGTSTVPITFYVYGKPNIQLTAVPQGQITPGGQNLFDIEAINTGTDTATNVSVTFLSTANFTPYGATKLSFGTMAPNYQSMQQETLLLGSGLTSGTFGIPVQVSYVAEDGAQYSNNAITIPVSFVNGNPDIVASIASAMPTQLIPGGNQTLNILVQNNGYGEAKNLTIKFLNSGPLSVTGSAAQYFIGNLQAGASVNEQVQLTASSNANLTQYNLPVSISYSNLSAGSSTTVVKSIPIKLQNSAIFNITAVEGSLSPGGTDQPLTFVIKNTGNEPAQQVTLSLQTIYPITPVNPNYYITSLQPGESVNVTFYADIDTNGKSGTYPVTLYEQWRQPNGYTTQQYSSSNNYYANVSTSNLLGSYSWVLYAVIIVLAIIGGRYYYKNIYMKKKKKA